MTWELYEVWARTVDGHEDLIETTKSLKEAREIAELNIDGEVVECVIYKETEDGNLEQVETIQ